MPAPLFVRALARAFLAGQPTVDQIVARGSRALGRPWRWLRPLAQRYVEHIEGRVRLRRRDAIQFLRADPGVERAEARYRHELSVADWLTEPQLMQPVFAAGKWDLPPLESAGALRDWLRLNPGELEWFADLWRLGSRNDCPKLRHYYYRVLAKRSGGLRLIEAPKQRMKQLQRMIVTRILARIPPHPAAHGFIPGRSIRTFAAPHLGRRVVVRMDLRDFFPSISGARIQALFRTLGYPEPVADLLGGICVNVTPRSVWKTDLLEVPPRIFIEARTLYARPHLPQGAPTSPALSNLCAYRVDCRLAGLAQSSGARYTRYADDLAFSGGEAFERGAERFSTHVSAILREEGFAAHHRKTRIMRQGVRQHLAGLVVNERMNIRRDHFDRLKAILNNCVRLGPETQNREAHSDFRSHLEGRVAYVETVNPARGGRLRVIFNRIEW
ncbi:MAG TPA: reverse transcriptase family protein [Bryobacteraceae bacterium]|nr:reverse transcriptase family protein [Bryobacteraceae bacterium]